MAETVETKIEETKTTTSEVAVAVTETPEAKAARETKEARLAQLEKDILEDKETATPVAVKEAAKETPTIFTPEHQRYLDLINDPVTKPLIELAEARVDLEGLLSKAIPAGRDYSNVKEEDYAGVIEESLRSQGWTDKQIKAEIEEYTELKDNAKRKKVEEAVKFLRERKPAFTPELNKLIQSQVQAQRQKEQTYQRAVQEGNQEIETAADALIGKDIFGVAITQDNVKELKDYITACSLQVVQTPQGGRFNTKRGIEYGTKAFAFDKVVKEKDNKIADLKNIIKLRKNPSANGGGGAAHTLTVDNKTPLPAGGKRFDKKT